MGSAVLCRVAYSCDGPRKSPIDGSNHYSRGNGGHGGTDLDTILGEFSFDGNGDAVYDPIVLIVRNGEFEVFE